MTKPVMQMTDEEFEEYLKHDINHAYKSINISNLVTCQPLLPPDGKTFIFNMFKQCKALDKI